MVWGCTYFLVEIRNENDVWLGISSHQVDPTLYHRMLFQNELKQNVSLMTAKAVIAILGQS